MATHFGRIREHQDIVRIKDSDRKFIYELEEDSRKPLTALAKKLHVSKDTAHYTLNKLLKSNVIEHLGPVVDLTRLGYQTFHVFFVVHDIEGKRENEFMDYLANHPNTKALMEYSDRWGLEWTVIAKDILDFDKITSRTATLFSDIIIEKSKLEVIKGFKSTTLASRKAYFEKESTLYVPDNYDRAILACLNNDGRMSSYEISEKIGMSPNNVRYRLKNLVRSNVIRHFTTTVNLNSLGYHLYTIGVLIKSLDEKQEAKLREYLFHQRFITRAVKVLGYWDLLITIVSDTIRNYHKTIKDLESEFSDIVINYEALTAYREKTFKYVPEIAIADVELNK
ncbi:Lrp/AsnC family transcriptional regulator [Nanoarchaeota archaeon]